MKKLDNRIKKFMKDADKQILTDEFMEDAHLYDMGALFGEYLCDEEEGKVFIKAKEKFDKETDKKIDSLIKKHFKELR